MANFNIFIKNLTKKSFFQPLVIIFIIGIIITVQVISNKKSITVIVDGHKSIVSTSKNTTFDILKELNIQIGPKDKIIPDLSSQILKDGLITIKKAVNLTVSVDGKVIKIQSCEDNISSMLKSEGISIKPEDIVKPDKNTLLSEGLRVEIARVEIKNIFKNIPLEYKTITRKDSTRDINYRKVLQEGKKGEKQVKISLTYENGKETSRKIISEKVTKKPIEKILIVGTIQKPIVSRGASNLSYSRLINAKATAYYAFKGVGKTYTSTGRQAVRDPSGYSTIAVDPKVIPYGTKMYIEGYGYAIAADTGGAIVGNKIDVYFDTRNEAIQWGVKHVNVYILE